jgi:hypothetical protein
MGSSVSLGRSKKKDGSRGNSNTTTTAQNQIGGNKDPKIDENRANVPGQTQEQDTKSQAIRVYGESLKQSDQSDAPSDQKGYFYVTRTSDGKKNKAGPFKLNEMKQFLVDKMLDDSTLVWHKSFGTVWKPLADIPSLNQQQFEVAQPLKQQEQEDAQPSKQQQSGDAQHVPHEISPEILLDSHEALLIASRDGDVDTIKHLIRLYQEQVSALIGFWLVAGWLVASSC